MGIIRAGRVVDAGSLTELRHLTRTSVDADLVGSPNGLADLPGVHECHPPTLEELFLQHCAGADG